MFIDRVIIIHFQLNFPYVLSISLNFLTSTNSFTSYYMIWKFTFWYFLDYRICLYLQCLLYLQQKMYLYWVYHSIILCIDLKFLSLFIIVSIWLIYNFFNLILLFLLLILYFFRDVEDIIKFWPIFKKNKYFLKNGHILWTKT